jgi:hypothetical protein
VELILSKNHFKIKKLVEGLQKAPIGFLRRKTTISKSLSAKNGVKSHPQNKDFASIGGPLT